MRGLGTLRADPAGTILGASATLTIVLASLSWGLPSVRALLISRHQGDSFIGHIVGLPWPGMYSYTHHVVLEPDGVPADSSPECVGPFHMTPPHMAFSTEVEMVRSLEVCGYKSGIVRIESTDGTLTRQVVHHYTRTDDGWTIR